MARKKVGESLKGASVPASRETQAGKASLPSTSAAASPPLSLGMFVVTGLLGLFLSIYLLKGQPPTPPPSLWNGPVERGYNITGQVERIDWSTEAPFAEKFVREGKAVVLTNLYATKKWAAFGKWNESYMRRQVQELMGVYRNDVEGRNTFFFYDDLRPMHGLPGIKWEERYSTVNMTTQAFFDGKDWPSRPLYYVSPLSWMPDEVRADASPNEAFSSKPSSKPVQNIWMGHRGCTSSLHYDPQENFYVQIEGRKKFILFPPSEWRNMYVHPALHPEFRQSQVDVNHVDLASFPKFAQAKAIETILSPGDVLYLPPYWWHRVIALDLAFSVNTWTRSAPELGYKPILEATVPFSDTLPPDVLLTVLTIYTEAVIDGFFEEKGAAKQFVEDILGSRYALLASKIAKIGKARPEAVRVDAKLCRELDFVGSNVAVQAIVQTKTFSDSVATALREFGDVGEVLLADWLEEITAFYVGLVGVPEFLRECVCR